MAPALTAYASGMRIRWKSGAANASGAITLDAGPGVKAVKKANGTTDPGIGELVADAYYDLTYDGAAFRLPAASSAASASGCIASVSRLCLIDEFIPTGIAVATAVGQMNWAWVNEVGGGNASYQDSVAGHEGIFRIQPAAALNDSSSIRQNSTVFGHSRLANTEWTAEFIVKPNDVTNSRSVVGFTNAANAIVVYQSGGGNWKAEACTSGCYGAGGADTGVAAVSGTWYYIRMSGTGTGVNVSVNGSAPVAMTGTFPTVAMRGYMQSVNIAAGGGRSMDVDFFSMERAYGARY